MATPTYTALATTTLASASSSVTFSSIPATYRDLVLVIDCSFSTSGIFGARLNGDSAANYSLVFAKGPTTTYAGGSTFFSMGDSNTSRHLHIMQIMDYSATDKHKIGLVRSNDSSGAVWMFADRWANTAAVYQVSVHPSAGNITAGSTISLFGIEA